MSSTSAAGASVLPYAASARVRASVASVIARHVHGARARARASSSAVACGQLTPGRSRARTVTIGGIAADALPSGIQTSAPIPTKGYANVLGITPMTARSIPSMSTCAVARSPASSCCRQNASLTTTTGGPPRRSALVKVRPSAGRTDRAAKKPGEA
jgi:hypothetical protein